MAENEIVCISDESILTQTLAAVAGQLAPSSAKKYMGDARAFVGWLTGNGLTLTTVSRDDMIGYRQYLSQTRAKVTAARMLTVARRLLAEAVEREVIAANPAAHIRGFKNAGKNETTHVALTQKQASDLLAAIDRTSAKGSRDYALILLLLRTGIRRGEASGLQIGDLAQASGHFTLTIQHGKGDVRRVTKVPVDVRRALAAYLEATHRNMAAADAPLFVRFYKGDTPGKTGLSGDAIADIVGGYARAAEIADLSPHGLRATFVTLALEGGAKLQQVQYAAGHADPRTTERYQKRKLNLDDNAVDYVRIYSKD